MAANPKIYSATYSNVPVYEFNVSPGNHVMRRRADDWINATHILKVAAYDKPARTRILEREVQKGVHEKVQGGYGKYQGQSIPSFTPGSPRLTGSAGTWIPLHDGRALAERNGVLDKLLPIFDFVPGDRSPPPAPKHATAASSRPRVPRQHHPARRDDQYDAASVGQYQGDETPDNITIISDSMMEDDPYNSQYANPRKRKRAADQISVQDQQHQIWADALLDYFMLLESDDCFPAPPHPPPGINLDKAIDEKGHSAMHWAAAMGAIDIVKELMSRNARIDCVSNNLETPFMHSVLFTNNFDKQTMPKLARLLLPTVRKTDWFGSTVFHHIAATTSSRNKYLSARYYFDSLINVLLETWVPSEVTDLLNKQDKNGDTALHIAAQNGARKCVRALLGRNVAVDIPNQQGVTADDLIRQLNERRRTHHYDAGRARDMSSSPFAPDGRGPGVNGDSLVPAAAAVGGAVRLPDPQYRSQTATALMARIAPAILDKCRQLASTLEADVEIKEQEALEAERVARKRGAEVDSLRRQAADLGPLQLEASDPDLAMSDEREERELRGLIEEAEALLEMESVEELRLLIESSSQHRLSNGDPSFATSDGNDVEQPPGAMGPPAVAATNGISGADVNALAQKLARAQRERQKLVRDSVKSMSVAGLGEKQGDYKRLLRAALGVKDAEVEGMLNEVLKELEQEKEMAMLEEEG